MTTGFSGARTLMRIFLGEADHCQSGPHKGKPLYEALLLLLRQEGCAGATAVRAIAGFGASARLHTSKVLRLSSDLPIILEVVDEEPKLQAILPKIEGMMGGGLVTMEPVKVIVYRAGKSKGDDG